MTAEDALDPNPPSTAERLNAIANAVQSSWPEHVPLSVRYGAAAKADDIVQRWFAARSEPSS